MRAPDEKTPLLANFQAPIPFTRSSTFRRRGDTLNVDVSGIIHSYLDEQDLIKMALASERQWSYLKNIFIFNKRYFDTLSALSLFYTLENFWVRIPDDWEEEGFYSTILLVGRWISEKAEGRWSLRGTFRFCGEQGLLKAVKKNPELAFQIMKEPPFRALLETQYPAQVKRRTIDNKYKKAAGVVVGGVVSLVTAAVATALLAPLWLIAAGYYYLCGGAVVAACDDEMNTAPRLLTNLLLTPWAIVHSFFHGVRTGFQMGVGATGSIVKDTSKAVYASFFNSYGVDFLSCGKDKLPWHYLQSPKTIADVAAGVGKKMSRR